MGDVVDVNGFKRAGGHLSAEDALEEPPPGGAAAGSDPTKELREALEAKTLNSRLPAILDRLEAGIPRIPTGWTLLDKALDGGLVMPSLNVVGAKPKIGKSTWAQIVAERHVARGGVVYYLDLENGEDRFVRRLLCRRARVGPNEVRLGWRDPEGARRWGEAIVALGEVGDRLIIDTDRSISPSLLELNVSQAREKAGERDLLVVIDSLQKLPMQDLGERRAGIDAWLLALQDIRDRYRVAIMVVSEIKRPAAGSTYRANETAFKESGGIEYTADCAMTLDREGDEEDDALEPGAPPSPATLRVMFNRDGRTGAVASYTAVFPHYGMEEVEPVRPAPKEEPTTSTTRKSPRGGRDVGFNV